MEQALEQIRDQQKQTWDTFAPGWKKWDNWVMNFIHPAGDAIITHLKLKDTDHVLDIATGTGEPGLSIAAIVTKGKVVGFDLSSGMLEVARENALRRELNNYETKEGDASALPFPDATFDAVSCRFGFMFFPDMTMVAKEIFRVLKPGGKFATTVWGTAEKNFWITSFMGPIMRNMKLPAPPPEAPGMFRCANTQQMEGLFSNAGFKNIIHEEVATNAEAESVDFLWTYMNEVAAPVVQAMSKADDGMKLKIKDEIFQGIKQKHPETGPLKMESQAVVYYMEK